MKKSFVAVALVMGLGTTVAFAENLTSGVETVMAVNDFTPIEVKDLPLAGSPVRCGDACAGPRRFMDYDS